MSHLKYLVVGLTVLLAVLHQDYWWWDSKDLVFGFLPIGLAWHVGISVAAALVGLLAVTWCWPAELDEEPGASGSSGGPGEAS